MLLSLTLLVFRVALSGCNASPAHRSAPSYIPSIWSTHGDVLDGSATLRFTFGLSPANANGYDALESRLTHIAETRGDWLTDDELAPYVSPSVEAKIALNSAIEARGYTCFTAYALKDRDSLLACARGLS